MTDYDVKSLSLKKLKNIKKEHGRTGYVAKSDRKPKVKKETLTDKYEKSNLLQDTKRGADPYSPLFVDYLSLKTFANTPISLESIEKLGQEFVTWAINEPEAIVAMKFFLSKGVGSDSVDRFKEISPKFAAFYREGFMALGGKREEGSLKNYYNASTVNFSMPIYDKKWRELSEWKAALARIPEQTPTRHIVVMNSFEVESRDKELAQDISAVKKILGE